MRVEVSDMSGSVCNQDVDLINLLVFSKIITVLNIFSQGSPHLQIQHRLFPSYFLLTQHPRFPSYLLLTLYFLFNSYLPRFILSNFPSVSFQASLPFLSCCHRTTQQQRIHVNSIRCLKNSHL